MKNKFLTIGLPILGGLVIAGVGIASAAGFMGGAGGFGGWHEQCFADHMGSEQATLFQNEATALGYSGGDHCRWLGAGSKHSADRDRERHQFFAVSDRYEELCAVTATG